MDGFFLSPAREIRKTIPEIPSSRLYDEAQVFSDPVEFKMTEFQLNASLDLWKNSIRIAIFKSLDGEDIERYSEAVFNKWQMNKSPRHDSILIAYYADVDKVYLYTEPTFSRYFDEDTKLRVIESAKWKTKGTYNFLDHVAGRAEMEYLQIRDGIDEQEHFNLFQKIQYFYNYQEVSFWGILVRIIISVSLFIYLYTKLFTSKSDKSE